MFGTRCPGESAKGGKSSDQGLFKLGREERRLACSRYHSVQQTRRKRRLWIDTPDKTLPVGVREFASKL
jgi:hypothetical protein